MTDNDKQTSLVKMKNFRIRSVAALSLAVLLLLTIGVTAAWFVNYQVNKISGSTVKVDSDDILQFALIDEANSAATLSYTNTFSQDCTSAMPKNITGDGIAFWMPDLIQGTASASVNSSSTATWTLAQPYSTTNANGLYLHYCIRLRSDKAMDVYLGSDSYVNATTSEDLISNDSNYGEFSRNYIAAAARVSFLNTTLTENNGAYSAASTLGFVWVPNSTWQLTETNGVFTFTKNGTAETNYYYYTDYGGNGTSKPRNAFSASNIVTTPTALSTSATAPQNGNGKIATLTLGNDGSYYATVSINVWVEGCDRECRRALAGGAFDVSLQLIGYIVTE